MTDASGRYAAMYRPYHLIGLELDISVSSARPARRADRRATGFRGDVVAMAKRDLRAGEMLDGEGGYTVWGKLMPAADACPGRAADRPRTPREAACGRSRGPAAVTWSDVEAPNGEAVRFRREMEQLFAGGPKAR